MINKIENLISIGKYRNYTAAGAVNFRKMTLIYGDNGGGKTTLTAVIRSLANNNPDLIQSRRSTDATANQAAQISYTNGTTSFHTYHHARGWSAPLSDIEVFDIHFVNDNIYSGFAITEDNKRNLHQFVVGAQGIAIQAQIEGNKTAKTSLRLRRTELDLQLLDLIRNGLINEMVPELLAMTDAPADLATQIATAEIALTNANANAIIQTLQLLSQVASLQTGLDFPSMMSDVDASIQTIQDNALRSLFDGHCQEIDQNGIQNPQNWVQMGFRYIQTKVTGHTNVAQTQISCPFCRQAVDQNSDILRAYVQRFNDAFNAFVQRLQNHLRILRDFNIENAILLINGVNETNRGRIDAWSRNLNVAAPQFIIIPDVDNFRRLYQLAIDTLEQKVQNPSLTVPVTNIADFRTLGGTINRNVLAYNQAVNAYNQAATTFRNGLQTPENALQTLQRLRRIQRRFETDVVVVCNEINDNAQQLRTLEAQYTRLSGQQETDATAFLGNYCSQINYYLTDVFRTLFRIEEVEHIAPQGRSTQSKLGYKLKIDGHEMAFQPGQPLSTRECLSEGDKSTIALAFFLSKLDIDPAKANKIMIFDDPLSSLDTNRRNYTISIICRLYRELKQVVVLSHSEAFLHDISTNIDKQYTSTLHIVEYPATKESKIAVCDLDELVKSKYLRDIEYIERFRTAPNHAEKENVLGTLRTILEANLKFKFYRQLRSMPGLKTFGNVITYLDQTGVTFSDSANRQGVIDTLRMINNVSWKPHHGEPMPDLTRITFDSTTITAGELNNLIVDTLDLIDRRI